MALRHPPPRPRRAHCSSGGQFWRPGARPPWTRNGFVLLRHPALRPSRAVSLAPAGCPWSGPSLAICHRWVRSGGHRAPWRVPGHPTTSATFRRWSVTQTVGKTLLPTVRGADGWREDRRLEPIPSAARTAGGNGSDSVRCVDNRREAAGGKQRAGSSGLEAVGWKRAGWCPARPRRRPSQRGCRSSIRPGTASITSSINPARPASRRPGAPPRPRPAVARPPCTGRTPAGSAGGSGSPRGRGPRPASRRRESSS